MKKLHKLAAMLFMVVPLFSCSVNGRETRQVGTKFQGETLTLTSSEGSLYEVRCLYAYSNGAGEYEDPTALNQTKKLTNGATDIGKLTIAGDFTNEGIKTGVSNNGYTSLKAEGSDISMSYTFHSITNCSLKKYSITNCDSTSLAGFSLGSGRIIGTGAVLLVKMNEGGNWQLVSAWTSLKDGYTTPVYKPSYEDISKGTYYKFIAAYQFQVQDGSILFVFPDYRGYSVMQDITVRIGIGGASIKFTVDYTDEQTFNVPSKKYEQDAYPAVALNGDNLVEAYSNLNLYYNSSIQDLGTVKLTGEILRGTNNEKALESDAPIYVYNGQTGKINLNFKNNANSRRYDIFQDLGVTQIDSDYIGGVAFNSINFETYGGFGTSVKPGKNILIIEYKEFKQTSEPSDSVEAPYKWVSLAYKDNIQFADFNYEITSSVFNLYSDFRVLFLSESLEGNVKKIHIMTSYFTILVNTSKFTDSYTLDEDQNIEASLEYNAKANALTEAISLEDGSVCCSKIGVYNSETSYKVEVSKNNEPYTVISSFPAEFKDTGIYRFRVTNSFGDVSIRTIYLLDLGDDNGRHIFFPGKNNSLVDEGKRMYDPNSRIPVYATNSEFFIYSNDFLPGLIGSISTINERGEKHEIASFENLHREMNGIFSEEGEYLVTIKTGVDNAFGDQIKYTFHFKIKNPEGYIPTINYNLLHSGAEYFNLMPKVYNVPFKSKGSGTYNFVFPYNDEGLLNAQDFAEKIEALDITYPSGDSSSYEYKGKTYTSRLSLYADLRDNAEKRVGKIFLDSNFATTNVLDYYLSDVQDSSIDQDVFVVSSEAIFSYLVTDQVFLNNFSFRQVRDFETSSVVLENVDTGVKTPIKYGEVVNDVLTESGKYKISETNWAGNVNTYYASYLTEGDNTSAGTVRFSDNGVIVEKQFDQENHFDITSDNLYFKSFLDPLDDYAVITITNKGNNESVKYLFDEISNTVMDQNGEYQITVSNRLNYSYSFNVSLTGTTGSTTWLPHIDKNNKLAGNI